jgi:uncharacterized low-complexity protein
MKNTMKKSLSAAAGITFAATMSAVPVVNADTSPFGMQNLEGGYMQVAEAEGGESKVVGSEGKSRDGGKAAKEGKCGEGKCGESKVGGSQGKNKAKGEGKCGEGKCGEGKVGGSQGKHGEAE